MARRFLAAAAGVLALASGAAAADWPAWRGAEGLGICAETDLPLEWSPTENVRWKIPLPDAGNSTPAIWGRKIFLTQAVEKGRERMLLCLDREDGAERWRRTVRYEEPEPTHGDNPYCSASPATDGERVVVSHGSAGVHCYDLDGKELWSRNLGKLHHVWGNASSPVLRGDRCYINCGPGDRTFLIALEKRTGEPVWQIDIPGGLSGGDSSTWTGSWSDPIFVRAEEREDLVISYPFRLLGLDPATGKERWRCEGLGRLVYTSPIAGSGVIVAMSGYMGPPLAVRAGGEGDVTATRRLWRFDRAQQRIGSGVIAGGRLYLVNETGVGECLELESGEAVWRERVCGTTWSSLVLSGDRLYLLDQSGDCVVFRAGPKFEVLARSSLGERTRASIAPSGGEIFIRTYEHLWCIRRPERADDR